MARIAFLPLLIVALGCGVAHRASAATYTTSVATYNFVATAGHTAITTWDGTVGCPDTTGDDSLSRAINIGFTFTYGTTAYTQLRVSTNGAVLFNSTFCTFGTQSTGPPRTYTNLMANTNSDRMMRIYGADLDLSAGGSLTYATIGTAPNRTFVVTWNAVPQWSATGTSYNLQIQLAENGDFYFMYGVSKNTAKSGEVLGPAQIGWQLTTTDYVIVQSGLPANSSGWKFTKAGAGGFKITYGNTGIFCLDQAVTLIHTDASGNPASGYSGTVNLTTTSGRGSWLLVSGQGTLADGVPDDGAANYTFSSAESKVGLLLRYRGGAAVVTAHAVDSSVATIVDDGTQGSIQFDPDGFTVTSSALSNPVPGTIPAFASPQTAGTNVPLYLTAYGQIPNDSQCGVITSYTGVKSLKFWSTYLNPNTGTVAVSINASAIATSEGAAVAQSVTFTNGQASVTAKYKDAGSLSINMKDDTTGNALLPNGIRGSTGPVVMRPANFSLSAIRRTDNNAANPGATSAAGPIFLPAGRPFSLTVTAIDAEGSATKNFGKEGPAESVDLNMNLVLPAGGHAPAIASLVGFGAFSNGQASATDFSWPEVGIIQLIPHIRDGSYLAAGDVTGSASGNVGRFVPDSFAAAPNVPVWQTACTAGGFSYIGQPLNFAVAPVLTVTALAYGGATAQNYVGSFFQLTNASLSGRNYSAASGILDTSGLPSTAADPLIAPQGAGIATLTFSAGSGLLFQRTAATTPFNAAISLVINIIDLDGAAAANPVTIGGAGGMLFSAGNTQWYGRLAFKNAVGSELLDLPVPLRTEYYAGATQGFVVNTVDSCTSGVTLALSGYQGHLSSGLVCVRDTGAPGVSGVGCAAPAAVGSQFRATASLGDFNLIVAATGAGHDGSVTVTGIAPAWLKYTWSSAAAINPTALPSFGLFRGHPQRIYQNEVY
jgi:hypothetical protein